MPSPQEIYDQSVRPLPPAEQLQIAALILQALTRLPPAPVDGSDAWTEDDMGDLIRYSLQHASVVYPEGDELVPGR